MLAIRGPTLASEELYIESVNRSVAALRAALEQITRSASGIPNRDLDTGEIMVPGGYPLTDQTYARLLDRITKDAATRVPGNLQQDIASYYSDPAAPISSKRNPKQWARIQKQLLILSQMPPGP